MPSALLNRLAIVYDESLAMEVGLHHANWAPGFGNVMADIRTVVAHQTAGWPSRERALNFVRRFDNVHATEEGRDVWGQGPQFYITADGTVFRLIDMPLTTLHGRFVNPWAIGVETGRASSGINPAHSTRWRKLSDRAEDDVPGANLYLAVHPRANQSPPHDLLVCWFTSTQYKGPAKSPPPAGEMLFTESEYRTWARLARYLSAEFRIPRNFPLFPFELRLDNVDTPALFQRIVRADERFETIVAALGFSIQASDFELSNLGVLTTRYHVPNVTILPAAGAQARHNLVWLHVFNAYRGFHGHGFSGSTKRKLKDGVWKNSDHDCPGPLFDWYRFARETWDWWWHPFDFNDAASSTAAPPRGYRKARQGTPLIEHYFEQDELLYFSRIAAGISGGGASPTTFRLDEDSPVYASANGELVAAGFPAEGAGVSLAFVLIRHEIYHQRNPALSTSGASAGLIDSIDYDREPSYAYSLVIHLGRPDGMSFEKVVEGNPDWLNRVLMRLMECDLGLANHPGSPLIPDHVWAQRPPGSRLRPTTLEGWQLDQTALRAFLTDLRAGGLALAPMRADEWVTPVRIVLGDWLGIAGTIGRTGSTTVKGIRMEVFSADLLSTDFSPMADPNGWPATTGVLPAVVYQSEWARNPSAAERASLQAMGADPDLVNWWNAVAACTLSDAMLPAAGRLPWDGVVWHYRTHDFMRWLNTISWRSEWLLFDIATPRPLQPQRRRI